MKHLLRQLKKLTGELRGEKIYLFLDYDGTIVPLAATPQKAVLTGKMAGRLRRIVKNPAIIPVIVSGRALKDIKSMVKLPGIIYAGNHGLEIDYYGRYLSIVADKGFEKRIQQLKNILNRELKGIRGVILENKGVSLGAHYRLVAGKEVSLVKKIFYKITKSFIKNKQLKIKPGKKVLEIVPALNWDKGKFVKWLLDTEAEDKNKITVFYLGDDKTDEDAFKVLGKNGYTVFVGTPGHSAARYFLRSTEEVGLFLDKLTNII
jgi:trehalose-phosphatase